MDRDMPGECHRNLKPNAEGRGVGAGVVEDGVCVYVFN